MAAPKGNRFAVKDEAEKRSEALYVRMKGIEKDACREAAGDRGLSEWAREVLLSAVSDTGYDSDEPTSQLRKSR
jgi:hypothetical protein